MISLWGEQLSRRAYVISRRMLYVSYLAFFLLRTAVIYQKLMAREVVMNALLSAKRRIQGGVRY